MVLVKLFPLFPLPPRDSPIPTPHLLTMFAFVPTSGAPLASAFSGVPLRSTCARPTAAVRMSGKSASVPFLDAPPKLGAAGELPAGVQFDPLGFSNMWDIDFLTEAEIKHGRICMLAMAGWVFPELVGTLPAAAYQATNPLAAVSSVGFLPMAQIFLLCVIMEGVAYNKKAKSNYADPGNYGWDAFGLMKKGGNKNHYRIAEVKNGRLAMYVSQSFSCSFFSAWVRLGRVLT